MLESAITFYCIAAEYLVFIIQALTDENGVPDFAAIGELQDELVKLKNETRRKTAQVENLTSILALIKFHVGSGAIVIECDTKFGRKTKVPPHVPEDMNQKLY